MGDHRENRKMTCVIETLEDHRQAARVGRISEAMCRAALSGRLEEQAELSEALTKVLGESQRSPVVFAAVMAARDALRSTMQELRSRRDAARG